MCLYWRSVPAAPVKQLEKESEDLVGFLLLGMKMASFTTTSFPLTTRPTFHYAHLSEEGSPTVQKGAIQSTVQGPASLT